MTGTASVLVCVLELLGRPPSSMPPIELVAFPPEDVSPKAEAFVRANIGIIYLITSTATFRYADCEDPRSLLKLASILVHEEQHVRHGEDERRAYEAQLGTLMRLGVRPDSNLYVSVVRSMETVLKSQARAAAAKRLTEGKSMAAAGRAP